MQTVLFFSHNDYGKAKALLQWIGELGGCKGHDLLLACNQKAKLAALDQEVLIEAQKHFDNVTQFTPYDEDERPWPICCNHAWRSVVFHIRDVVMKPWLWLEPDAVPLKPRWLDTIASEYEKCGKPFMGGDVNVAGSKPHMSGIAVYPARVVGFCRVRRMPDLEKEAWDMFFANEFLPHAHLTPLIQHIQFWPTYGDVPTFTQSGPEVNPAAVLFHRCKDDSLISRLRSSRQTASNPVVVAPEPIPVECSTPHYQSLPPYYFELERRITELERRLPLVICGPAANGVVESVAEQSSAGVSAPSLPPPRRRGKRMKQKKQRTPEQIQAARERMAKARAARKPKLTLV